MGPTQRPIERVGVQGAWPQCCSPRPRRRACLLKGCERPFVPAHPQARYCSAACQAGARRWRRWRASRAYRRSDQGQARRREQSRRYRERLRQAEERCDSAETAPREGQRAADDLEKSCCARPGCYELFVPSSRSPLKKCCGGLCRRALRRVREREARWRRRLGERLNALGSRPPPSGERPFG